MHTTNSTEFPKIPIPGVRFRIDPSIPPRQIIRYNIPKAFETAMNVRLYDMEVKGIIERADKEQDVISYVSPLVLVPKGANDFRIVVDYRAVNKAIIREPYPMPSLEKIWAKIPNGDGRLFFTKLDLKDAYFHGELLEEVRHYTTFMTANGLMRFKRLPFGLSCAPELFQRVMETLLLKCKNIVVYLDDILIFGRTLEELETCVTDVKNILLKNNLTINEKKSVYNKISVDFLGFTIDGSGILPTYNKISDIRLFKNPKDTSEVRSFLGMLTFISPFMKNFSHKTKPLRDLLSSNSKFRWEKEHQEAFDDLKEEAEKHLIKRGYFDEIDKTILYADASPWGLGAVLVQVSRTSERQRIIACASKSLTSAECRYPQLHREALAIVWSMERFAYYLLGRRFILRSDSEALMFMNNKKGGKDIGKRIMSRTEGWLLRTDHFWYEFEHVAGCDNIADAVSRIGIQRDDPQYGTDTESHELCSVTANPGSISDQLLALTIGQVREELLKDEELQTVMTWLSKNEKWPADIQKYQPFQKKLYLQGEILMKEEKMVLPSALRKRALRLAHRSHPGMSTMKNILRQGLWWLGMDREVEEFVKSCPECQLVTSYSHPPPITMTEMPTNPWDYVSMDFSTASESHNWKALVLTDNYSRFLIAIPMDKTDTEAVKKALKRVFNTYYIPKTLKTDNGPPFNSLELKSWLKDSWGVKLMHSTPLNPTENGLVERSMQGINKITAIAKLGKQNWKEALADYVAAYNSWPHHVTKIPPAELMFGRAVRGLLPDIRTEQRHKEDGELRDRDQIAKFERNTREDNRRRAQECEIKVGDIVLVAQQKRDKADTVYKKELYKVIDLIGAGRATVKDISTNKTFDRSVKFFKKFVQRTEEETETTAKPEHCMEKSESNWAQQDKGILEDAGQLRHRIQRQIKPPKRYIDAVVQGVEGII
ncbi:uncharacterized protein K02A2.6-like [Sabethes cyaneus]|uniref:uncharacterized protein K02A2.6-like n=1 Tax=Sabethes cyaneus TaxID=53552 RepID=UPI00237E1F45|nr:uncharacterized protein K02A2.6-like [Sabethes cyaneus]